ncbi:hypothetical protein [Streptomyces sp. NPDC059016]|uniref:hypothetical protein n=1 Tax=Streptomyces sp. NPDC059016 TaxID=3346699 RepID=UPI0036946E12
MAESTRATTSSEEDQPLPPIGSLTQRQVRGMDCVHCGIVLTAQTAVDLKPRPLRIADRTFTWFPRSCRRHIPPTP